ncbi:MAG: carbamoyl phosphate synthase large subunit [Bdellovibrionaceae bacterium]|nr:carbamoyl phosphate synthase large subunit [Pseudobdellovibrionaceae bacterium]
MPRKSGINKVLILGSGPIQIGQACEFDYSGTQACKALMNAGLEVILVNSNPATIMTDPELASRVYIEPLKVEFVQKILEKEKPDAIIPTLGGQTALNLGLELESSGVLDRLGIKMLGANQDTIRKAEDREEFRKILDKIGAKYPSSEMVKTYEQGVSVGKQFGFPIILRPNYTLGGGGGGIAYSAEEYEQKLVQALHESPTSEVLVEESILGWKEYELEVMRDCEGTFVVICSIENIDPCGVHTGDSITVAPQQTLSDPEYQLMRLEAKQIIEEVGVETGGANVQFAVNPKNGERVVIEMNPRVSRSSALASKATGFPIAKIAALLAIGYTLDEIKNDITGTTPSCYEPALDYVVTKIPRFAFEKFQGSKDLLSTQMKSVGEVMSIGRTFKESFMKALLSMEGDPRGFKPVLLDESKIVYPNSQRMHHLFQAIRQGHSLDSLYRKTFIDMWFLNQFQEMVNVESELVNQGGTLSKELLLKAKRTGFSDAWIATLQGVFQKEVREFRRENDLRPRFFQVDTCAGEFQSDTPYFYSTYWSLPEPLKSDSNTVILLGSGPNRIGQGIEFDYSCVRSVRKLKDLGFRVVMVNSNPETVSTDYDTSDELFFEPLTEEHVGEILHFLQPKGFISQVGGQTPILLAPSLIKAGFKMLGSSMEAMDLAEDRAQFIDICRQLDFKIPKSGMASDLSEAQEIIKSVPFPILCRPSYVLGGRRMEIVENESELESYFKRHHEYISSSHPCLIDQFLERALEVDIDLVRGPNWSVVGGIIEHIEAAGVHSGDSMGVLPPQRLKDATSVKIEEMAKRLADKMNILGFLNLQLAVKDDEVFMIEANPRSSRSVPFIAKAGGVPLVDLGVMGIMGAKAEDVKPEAYNWKDLKSVCVKGVVFPFKKFAESDSLLGPEMKSTGESMGRADSYGEALLKALVSSQVNLPSEGRVFLSLRDKDKENLLPQIELLNKMGYSLMGTLGTAEFLIQKGIECEAVKKVAEGRPNCVDRIRSGDVGFVINTTSGREAVEASFSIRRSCIDFSVPCITESDAAIEVISALNSNGKSGYSVAPL